MCWELIAGHYTSHVLSIAPAAVVGCDEPFVMSKTQHMNNLKLSKQTNVLQQLRGLGESARKQRF